MTFINTLFCTSDFYPKMPRGNPIKIMHHTSTKEMGLNGPPTGWHLRTYSKGSSLINEGDAALTLVIFTTIYFYP